MVSHAGGGDNGMQWGLYCLEGDWGESDTDRRSVEPTLEVLARDRGLDYIHRNVATRAELAYRLQEWLALDMKWWGLVLACHGEPGTLMFSKASDGTVTIEDLAELLSNRCANRIVHFGSCSTLSTDDGAVQAFLRTTGARAVSGYTAEVEWTPSACLDILYLDKLGQNWSFQLKRTYDYLLANAAGLVEATGFTIWEPKRVLRHDAR